MSERVAALALLLSCIPAPCQEQGTVGPIGHWDNIEVAGAETFSARSICLAVAGLPDYPAVAHPTAPVAPFVAWVEEQIAQGYRFFGFPEARVEARADRARNRLVVRIVEGPRYRAGGVVVEGADAVLAEKITAALAKPVPQVGEQGVASRGSTFWKRGDPADVRAERLERAWLAVPHAYASVGRIGVTGKVDVVYREDGTADLRVRVESEGRVIRIGAPEWKGDFRDDPAAIAARVDLHPGETCTTERVREITRAISALCRYRGVRVRPGEPDAEGTAPLLIELEQLPSTPAFEDMPWADLALLRRGVDWVRDRLEHGASLKVASGRNIESGDWASLEGFEVFLSRDGLLVQLQGLVVGEDRLGTVVAAFDRRSMVIGCEGLSFLSVIPVDLPAPQVSLWTGPSPDGRFQTRWGLGMSKDYEGGAILVHIHDAVLLRAFRDTSVESTPERLLIQSGTGDAAFRLSVQRDAAKAEVSAHIDGGIMEIDATPWRDRFDRALELLREKGCREISPAQLAEACRKGVVGFLNELDPALALLLSTGWKSCEEALNSGSLGPLFRDGGSPFVCPPPVGTGDPGLAEILTVVRLLRTIVMDQVEYDSWAFVFVRDLTELALRGSREVMVASLTETERLLHADRIGPLAAAMGSWAHGELGLDRVASALARRGLRKLDFESFWRDALALAPEGSIGGKVFAELGTAWRELYTRRQVSAREDGWSAETLAAIEATFADCDSEDPALWARAGFRRLYEHGLRDGLAAYLETVAR